MAVDLHECHASQLSFNKTDQNILFIRITLSGEVLNSESTCKTRISIISKHQEQKQEYFKTMYTGTLMYNQKLKRGHQP